MTFFDHFAPHVVQQFGRSAEYLPADGGAAVPIDVIVTSRPTRFERDDTHGDEVIREIEVQVAIDQVPQPKIGAKVKLDSGTWSVESIEDLATPLPKLVCERRHLRARARARRGE